MEKLGKYFFLSGNIEQKNCIQFVPEFVKKILLFET